MILDHIESLWAAFTGLVWLFAIHFSINPANLMMKPVQIFVFRYVSMRFMPIHTPVTLALTLQWKSLRNSSGRYSVSYEIRQKTCHRFHWENVPNKLHFKPILSNLMKSMKNSAFGKRAYMSYISCVTSYFFKQICCYINYQPR